jgi:hypothetical protein
VYDGFSLASTLGGHFDWLQHSAGVVRPNRSYSGTPLKEPSHEEPLLKQHGFAERGPEKAAAAR